MNVNPEMQFIKWLAKLLEKYVSLIDNMERMQQDDVQKRLDGFTSNWLQLQDYCKQHAVNYLDYKQQILELNRYHERIVIYIENKPRGFSNRYLEIASKVIDEFLKFVRLPAVANLFREVVVTVFSSPPSFPLLAPPVDEPTIHEEMGYRTDASTTSGNYSTPPKTPEKFKKEQIPAYNNFYVTKLVLHQGALYKGKRGMLIELGMKFYDIKDVSCLMQITFWFATSDKAIMNHRSNTQAKLEKEVKPYTRNYDLSTNFFMSYSTLGLGTGLHKCKLKINATRLDNNEPIGNITDTFFELSDPA